MERKQITDKENRLLLLYALDSLGPVSSLELIQFLADNELMTWIDMQLNLTGLLAEGNAVERPHALAPMLHLTESGRAALAAFNHRIPASRRALIDQQAAEWRRRFRLEQSTPADSFTLKDGSCCLRLRLLEGETALMDLLLRLPPEALPASPDRAWRREAQGIYAAVLETLLGGFAGSAPAGELPADSQLQTLKEGEVLLSMTDEGCTMLLTLSSPEEARFCAARWQEARIPLTEEILRRLHTAEATEDA